MYIEFLTDAGSISSLCYALEMLKVASVLDSWKGGFPGKQGGEYRRLRKPLAIYVLHKSFFWNHVPF
jgi:hypothetical protein